MRNMSAAPRVAIPAPATTSAACRPRPVRCGLRVPKLRRQAFETAIIERYRRRESSVEESDLNKKIYGTIEAWHNRPIEGDHPYVYFDGIVLKYRSRDCRA
jgi:transposase-like protein